MTQRPATLSSALLARWPLPQPPADGDKEERGRVLIVGGSREIPGAVLLAAEAALRAGAGKLQVAVPASVAAALALRLPEARVVALPETRGGGLAAAGAARLADCAARCDALLAGPGMMDATATRSFLRALLPHCPQATLVLDALALEVVLDLPHFSQPVVLTPHAGEMAHLCQGRKEAVLEDAQPLACHASAAWRAAVVLKGATTHIACGPQAWVHSARLPGLGTSGSGDVLAGLVAGLAARGATAQQAACWGVFLHARAGARLARRVGPLGFLARELPAEIPALLAGR